VQPDPTGSYLDAIRAGNSAALGELFQWYRPRMLRLLELRMSAIVRRRFGPEDVLQDAFFDVSRRIDDYLNQAEVPFFVWLRFLLLQRLQMLERSHRGVAMRDVRREQPMPGIGPASAESLAFEIAGRGTTPTQAVARQELQDRLQTALAGMEPLDREVLLLRHFEELSNTEVAAVLSLTRDAASKRYVRALHRLRDVLPPPGE
jgi:RNA polymerase sigma-70 factor (ECF subfamily)